MKIKDIINKVDKKHKDDVFIGQIAEQLGIDVYNWDDQDRLTSYYIGNWYCTDTYVGYKVYFLDDEPVMVSSQTARKNDEHFEWLSKEAFMKVKDYILSFKENDEYEFDLVDLNEDIGETYKIHYHGALFDYHKNIPLFNGVNVSIIEYNEGQGFNEKKQYNPSLVKVKFHESDKTQWVELKELDFPFNINENTQNDK